MSDKPLPENEPQDQSKDEFKAQAEDQTHDQAQKNQAMGNQKEMPFAVVHGEPLSEIPTDLYIPPEALKVFLEAFEGPLDF